jgi:hypothetical protein
VSPTVLRVGRFGFYFTRARVKVIRHLGGLYFVRKMTGRFSYFGITGDGHSLSRLRNVVIRRGIPGFGAGDDRPSFQLDEEPGEDAPQQVKDPMAASWLQRSPDDAHLVPG